MQPDADLLHPLLQRIQHGLGPGLGRQCTRRQAACEAVGGRLSAARSWRSSSKAACWRGSGTRLLRELRCACGGPDLYLGRFPPGPGRAGAGALAPGCVAGRLPVPCARAGARVTPRQVWGRRGNVRGRARRPWVGRFPASPLTRSAAGLPAAKAEGRRPGSRSRDRGRSAEPADRLARHANLSLFRTAS